MKQKLILRQEAGRDLTEAHTWYEEKVPGLGSDFLLVVQRTLESIQENPAQFPLIYREVRRALRFIYDDTTPWQINSFPLNPFGNRSDNVRRNLVVRQC